MLVIETNKTCFTMRGEGGWYQFTMGASHPGMRIVLYYQKRDSAE